MCQYEQKSMSRDTIRNYIMDIFPSSYHYGPQRYSYERPNYDRYSTDPSDDLKWSNPTIAEDAMTLGVMKRHHIGRVTEVSL